MSEIQVFTPPVGGELRSLFLDDEPWFIAADVCEAVGHTNVTVALNMVDEEDKRSFRRSEALNFTYPIADQRVQSVNLVNESGMYSLILRSNVPGAKTFKRWVTHEVLPAIRKTGSYSIPSQRVPQNFADALELAAKQAREIEAVSARVAELEPAAESWNTLATATGDYSVADTAKILSRDPSIKIGQTRLFTYLRDTAGWIYRQGLSGRHRVY